MFVGNNLLISVEGIHACVSCLPVSATVMVFICCVADCPQREKRTPLQTAQVRNPPSTIDNVHYLYDLKAFPIIILRVLQHQAYSVWGGGGGRGGGG